MSTEENKPFGTWLREEMLRQGYEVDGPRAGGRTLLAKKSGISLSIISRTLNENRIPDFPALRAIGKTLGYTLAEMMVFAGIAEEGDLPAPVGRISQVTMTAPTPPKNAAGSVTISGGASPALTIIAGDASDDASPEDTLIGQLRDQYERIIWSFDRPAESRVAAILGYRRGLEAIGRTPPGATAHPPAERRKRPSA